MSMALKDAKALSDVIARGFTEEDKKQFQRTRAQEARTLGEAAEKRNSSARRNFNKRERTGPE